MNEESDKSSRLINHSQDESKDKSNEIITDQKSEDIKPVPKFVIEAGGEASMLHLASQID